MDIVDPHPTTITEVLKQRPRVPEFQRSFSWDSGNVSLFVEALVDQVGRSADDPLFIGQIVAYSGAEGGQPFLGIVDGQQRLTTITVIASVIRDQLKALGTKESLEAAKNVQALLIWPVSISGKHEEDPFLRLNSYDASFFRKRIQSWDIDPDSEVEHDSHKRIDTTYKDVTKLISGLISGKKRKTAKTSALAVLAETLGENLNLIIVRGSSAEGASDLFEVLNDRSVALTNVDLLKNFLAGRATTPAASREVVEELEPVFELGADNESLVNQFLRHYWISQHNDEKRGLYRVMRRALAKRIEGGATPVELARDFGIAARQYQQLVDADTGDEGADAALTNVRAAQAHSLYPLILASFRTFDLGELQPVSKAALVLFTRWAIIGRLDSSDLEDILFDLAFKVSEGQATPEKVVNALKAKCPTDSEFKDSLSNVVIRKPAWRRYVLYCLEERLREEQGKQELKVAAEKCHVEHIYPQTPKKPGWTRWSQHDEYINRLGNLTLLGSSINTALKNSSFTKKKARYKSSELELTKAVAEDYDKWNTKAVRSRQASLANLGLATWPMPS